MRYGMNTEYGVKKTLMMICFEDNYFSHLMASFYDMKNTWNE